jgi:hypothetical protein
MRAVRLTLTIVFAALALSTAACTSPTGPKPSGDDVVTTGI